MAKKKLSKKEREAYAIVASRMGKATLKKKGKKFFSQIGKKGAETRWGKAAK